MKAKKTIAIMLVLAVAALTLSSNVKVGNATSESITWLPPYLINGRDDFYNASIIGYRDGSTVSAIVAFQNTLEDPPGRGVQMNITSVILNFDTNKNITATDPAVGGTRALDYQAWYRSTISFTANLAELPNSYAHTYRMIVEHANGTGFKLRPFVTESQALNANKFVVMSSDQASAIDTRSEYMAYTSGYPVRTSAEALSMASSASVRFSNGTVWYARGDFATAKNEYAAARDQYVQAISTDSSFLGLSQQATLNATQTGAEAAMIQANAAMKQADAAMNQSNAALYVSYAYLLFGIGVVFAGIGVVIYAAKKPKAQ